MEQQHNVISEKQKRDLSQQMKQDWDARAVQNPMHWTVCCERRWASADFFESGRKQVHALTEPIFEKLGFDPAGKRMLEIGCGPGRLIPGFVELFAEVWGVDVSEKMLEQANRTHASPKVRFVKSNGFDLAGIPDSHFDFVFSYLTFQHLPERWIAFSYLAESYRVLRAGGIFQLQFMTGSRPVKARIYLLLPRPTRKPAVILYNLITLRPGRIQRVLWPGGDDTWMGKAFKPKEIEEECLRLGFAEVQTLPDESHPPGTRFWAIGRKVN